MRWCITLLPTSSLPPQSPSNLSQLSATYSTWRRRSVMSNVFHKDPWASLAKSVKAKNIWTNVKIKFRKLRQYEIKSEVHSDKALLNVWAQCPTCERQCSGATALQRWRCEFVPDKNTQVYTSTSGMWARLLITHRFFKISVDAVDLSWGNTLGYRQRLSSVLSVTGLEYAALRRTDRKWGKLPAHSLSISTVSLLAQGRKHWSNAPFKQILSSFCMSYVIIMYMW